MRSVYRGWGTRWVMPTTFRRNEFPNAPIRQRELASVRSVHGSVGAGAHATTSDDVSLVSGLWSTRLATLPAD
jgi:hypothetical protein